MIITLVAMVAAALVVAAIAYLASSRRETAPTLARGEPPTSVDRHDFRAPHAKWLIAVFSSATCASCAAVIAELQGYESADVVVTEIEVGIDPELHRKYGIDSVPTAVVADATGDARLAFVGPLGPEHRSALATTLGVDA